MLDNFLREVVAIAVGKNSEEIANLLYSKKHVNEFLIAKKLDITINQTRNILYRLSDHGLVSSIRKKDKKKGWYTYFWRLEILKALEFLREQKRKRLMQMKNQIKNRETREFYICERCHIEVNEENALLHDFTCNECGDIFTRKDNSKILKELKKQSDKINQEIKLIEQEITKEEERIGKVRLKELAKEKAEKAAKRAERKRKREREKKKAKKKPKKKAKKKVKKKVKKKIKKIIKTVKKAAKKTKKKPKKKPKKKVKKSKKKVKKKR
jgi:transcription factor E